MTLVAEIIEDWLAFRRKLAELDGIARSTAYKQASTAHALRRALGHLELAQLTASELTLWSATRAKMVAPATLEAEAGLLKQILNWAVDEGILAQRPKVPHIVVPNVEPPLPDDEVFVWYLKNLPDRHSEALEFMLMTGLAPHELARLQPRDMLSTGLHIGARDDFRVKTSARRRPVPLNKRARLIWDRWSMGLEPDTPVFPKEGTLQRAMKRSGGPAEAVGVTPKAMRKWFASKVAADHGEALLQRLLGHAPGSKVTRRHYVRSQEKQLHAAVDGLEIGDPQ